MRQTEEFFHMMYNVYEFPDLIGKKLSGNISSHEEQRLREIIYKNPEAAAYYDDELREYRRQGFGRWVQDSAEIIVAFELARHAHIISSIRTAAAVLLLIISGALCFHYSLRTSGGGNNVLVSLFGSWKDTTTRILVVPKGKDARLKLPDGSSIHANADSRVEVQYSRNERYVNFKGEAYFKVAPSRRPFIIKTPYNTIEVLGTEFNVNTYDSGVTRITLVKGKIRFKTLNKDVVVQGGQELVSGPGGAFSIVEFTSNVSTAWQEGIYSFPGENFKTVIPKLERVFDVTIVVDDKELLEKPFSGWVDKSISLEENLQNLHTAVVFEHKFSGDTLHFYR